MLCIKFSWICDQMQPITIGNVHKIHMLLCRLKLGDLWSLFLIFVAYYFAVFEVNGQHISILMLIYFL
jgi:hypothetical protein